MAFVELEELAVAFIHKPDGAIESGDEVGVSVAGLGEAGNGLCTSIVLVHGMQRLVCGTDCIEIEGVEMWRGRLTPNNIHMDHTHPHIISPYPAIHAAGDDFMLADGERGDAVAGLVEDLDWFYGLGFRVPETDGCVVGS